MVKFKKITEDVEVKRPADHPTKPNQVARKIRTMTFDVNGSEVTRVIPGQFVGTLDKFIMDTAKGLQKDEDRKEVKVLEKTKYKANEVLVSDPVEDNI